MWPKRDRGCGVRGACYGLRVARCEVRAIDCRLQIDDFGSNLCDRRNLVCTEHVAGCVLRGEVRGERAGYDVRWQGYGR